MKLTLLVFLLFFLSVFVQSYHNKHLKTSKKGSLKAHNKKQNDYEGDHQDKLLEKDLKVVEERSVAAEHSFDHKFGAAANLLDKNIDTGETTVQDIENEQALGIDQVIENQWENGEFNSF